MPALTINEIAVLIVVLIAAITDVRTRKIYNWLTFPAAGIGIILNFVLIGWQEGLWSIGGWFIGVAIMVFPSMGKNMRFGDAKLMGAIGALLCPKELLIVFLYFCIFYGMVTVFVFAWKMPWKQLSEFVSVYSKTGVAQTESLDLTELQAALKKYIPLGPIIALGTLTGILIKMQTLIFLGFEKPLGG